MAKTLLIRDLSPASNEALERYKKEQHVAVNTDACMGILEKYYELEANLVELRRKYDFLRQNVDNVLHADRMLADAHQTQAISLNNLSNAYHGKTQPEPVRGSFGARSTLLDIFKEEEE